MKRYWHQAFNVTDYFFLVEYFHTDKHTLDHGQNHDGLFQREKEIYFPWSSNHHQEDKGTILLVLWGFTFSPTSGGGGELSQMRREGEEDKGQSFYKVKHDLKLP